MKVFIFSISVLFLVLSVSTVWGGKESRVNPNLVPMFGGAEKNAIQVAADESFIQDVVKAVGSRDKGSEEFVKKGWAAFFDKHDPATAMMRFNQAWLLNPENSDVLWGFGVVSGAMNNIDSSVKFLRQAAEKLTNNARVQADLGFSLTLFANQSDDAKVAEEIIAEAFACFAKAEKLESDYEPLFSNWAIALFLNKDYAGAWDKIIKAEKLGGKTLNPRFIKDLETKMPRPAN
ncbi:MAG: tetratricopeptide repeat protein [Candidatus Riflebacteria bacterium]|nr:tetratricopeptide repeat protein [Candidatus Riflebacteria bacterium]